MKLLTLNTHSLREENFPQKQADFVRFLLQERPDLIALQEVNQRVDAPALVTAPEGFVPAGSGPSLRLGNHALEVNALLRKAGVAYNWTWLGVKLGYGVYDEGVALFCRENLEETDCPLLSRRDDYFNWKTRRALGVRTGGTWFYSLHLGWWEDREEPFATQWDRLERALAEKRAAGPVWLLGDFNSPAEVRGEGYDRIARSGWQDTYILARERQGAGTAEGSIDGWRGREASHKTLRIDHIWCSERTPIHSSKVVLDGVRGPRVSDHFGVLVQTAPP